MLIDEEEPDLDYGELGLELESDIEVATRFERTGLQYGRTDWAPIHEALVAHRLAKGRLADGSKALIERVETDEDDVTILGRQAVPVEALPSRTKALTLARRLTAFGWQVWVGWSATHVAATLYQSDAAEDAKTPYQRGDVRFPAEDREHYRVVGRRGPLACRVYYQRRPGQSMTMLWGEFRDPVNGRVFFTPATAQDRTRWAERGLVPTPEPWEFDEWLDTVCPIEKRPKKKRGDDALLDGVEWKA